MGLKIEYFVLCPSTKNAKGKAAIKAIRLYALETEKEDPENAAALSKWMDDVESTVYEQPKKGTNTNGKKDN